MLKRKFYNACFIIGSFILMSVTAINKSGEEGHHLDTSAPCNCIPFIIKTEAVKAPSIQLNKNAAGFVKDYIKKNGYFLGKTKDRTAFYFSIMDSVFQQHGLPQELKYLSFVESGLKYNVISRAGAIGPWALMPVAAKQYGLKIGRNDERLDYYKSTHAAAKLLNDLFVQYGDWLLVVAAYNCGPGGIQKAMKRSGSRNYWALQSFLPEETRKHVKKFIAVHYYFERGGSLVTMTKAEREKYLKAMEAFAAKQQEATEANSLSIVVVK